MKTPKPIKSLMKFNKPYITGNELANIEKVFEIGLFGGNGEFTKKCHTKISNITKCKNILLTDSCTSALEISALLIRDRNKVQEVIVPSYTFSSTAAAFLKMGFKIVFCEINPENMMMDIEDAINKVTNNTVAIVPVHYGGFALQLDKLSKFCKTNNIYLVEDAAQGFGCFYGNNAIGTYGDFSCYSFHETKNLHAGLAGAIAINNAKFIDRAYAIWERGTNRQQVLRGLSDKYSWVEVGGSYYPTELQAAFLSAQLDEFKKHTLKRKEIFIGYEEVFKAFDESININHTAEIEGFSSNYHAFWVTFENHACCEYVRRNLSNNKIEAFIGYVPLHSSKVGKSIGYVEEDLSITEEYAKRILRFPFHFNMSNLDAKNVANMTIKLVKEFNKQNKKK